ncbi:MAG: hypothetical protein IAF38_19935 [Bacteroidia bacterium]|nr:hypothetical protein [Bacteroidia bacterium]
MSKDSGTLLKNPLSLFLFISLGLFYFVVAIFSSGTGDAGDSVNHFLFSKYAFQHPVLFLDLWNKPVFTLLTSPFAQFGISGVKIFNALCGCFSAFLLYKISFHYSQKNNFIVFIIFAASAFYFAVLNSALTEPLFNLALIACIYFYLKEKYAASAFLISFLPFIRQEGYPILLFFLFFYLFNRKFKDSMMLITGHALITIAGIFHHHKFLWVFSNNANASYGHYGHGGWFDYFHKLAYILGKPAYLFLVIGLLILVLQFFKNESKFKFLFSGKNLPAYLFLLILLSHAVFWRFGLFKSMGMERNMITVFGCAVLISFTGINFIFEKINNVIIMRVVATLASIVLIAYPFYPDSKKVQIPADFKLQYEQELTAEAAIQIRPFLATHKFYCGLPYAYYLLKRDPFDSTNNPGIYKFYPRKNQGEKCVVIWDNWLSVVEYGVGLNELENDTTLTKIFFKGNEKHQVAVFASNLKTRAR